MKYLATTILVTALGLSPMIYGQTTNAPAAPVSFKLLPNAEVDSSGIFLDQIVDLSGLTQPPHIRLARAPLSGQKVSLSRNEITSLVQSNPAGLGLTNWSGATQVHVARRLRILDDPDLLEVLMATLQKEYVKNEGELELHLTRPWAKPLVPDEPITLKVTQMPAMGVCPSFVVSFELWCGKERLGNWQVPLQAAVWHDIPMAHSALVRGESLKDADIMMERADLLIQKDVYLNYPTLNDNLELTENIPADHPVLNRSVRLRPLVARGQMVEAVFQDGTLGISLMVETLEDGALGQTVRVRNPKTRRELYGRVENEKTIRISL